MKKKILAIIIVSLFLMTIFSVISTHALNTISSSLTVNTTYDYDDYTPNGGVIYIRYNTGFVDHPAVARGDGSKNNPYIIENWRAKTIEIKDTTCYFEVNHCFIYYRDGIFFNRVSNAKIQDCVIENSAGACGIELFWSSNNEINDCSIIGYNYSFHLKSYSNNNIIKNCRLSDLDADSYGIALLDSNNNVIKQSLIEGVGKYAIDLDESYSNTFYHNTIKNTGTHVDGWVLNNWDNGEEGNYWSQYNGDDDNRDGIGDEPYSPLIISEVGDNYPLIKPYGTPFPPTIRYSGGEQGCIRKAYDYFFKTKDHNNDMVYYYIDWDDGTPNELIGPYNPNEETPTADNIHIYKRTGVYTIRAKARDVNGDESDWSAGFPVIMPRSRPMIFSTFDNFLEKFFEYFPMLRK